MPSSKGPMLNALFSVSMIPCACHICGISHSLKSPTWKGKLVLEFSLGVMKAYPHPLSLSQRLGVHSYPAVILDDEFC